MDISWIKITTDIFDDEKIFLIEQLPEHDSIIVIWFKLLALAGKSNNNGVFMLSNRIPYTADMFAAVFRRPVNTVKLALETFEQFGMIEIVDDVVTLPNWEKHQNIKTLDDVREQTRLRVQKHRENQKQQIKNLESNDCNVTCNDCSVTVTHKNRLDKDKDKDKNLKNIQKDDSKKVYGSGENVKLSDDEYSRLVSEYGKDKTDKAIEYLSSYKIEKGYKTKDDNRTLRRWVFDAISNKSHQTYQKGSMIQKSGCDDVVNILDAEVNPF